MGTPLNTMLKYSLLEFTDKHGKFNKGTTDHFLELEYFPVNGEIKMGRLCCREQVCLTFEFTRTQSGPNFNAWSSVNKTNSNFVLTPVMGVSGDTVGVKMTFPHLPQFVSVYGIEQLEVKPELNKWKKLKKLVTVRFARKLPEESKPVSMPTESKKSLRRSEIWI